MTAIETLRAVRFAGGDLLMLEGSLRLRAPDGCLPDSLRRSVRTHAEELRRLVLDEQRQSRRQHVTDHLAQLNERMGALAPWLPSELSEHRALAGQLDATTTDYLRGDAPSADRFEAALGAWEAALRTQKAVGFERSAA